MYRQNKKLKDRLFTIFLTGLVVVSLVFGVGASGASAVFKNNVNKKVPIYQVARNDKKISISFDCAWGVDYTDELLSVMEKYNVKCTFFPVKFWTEKYPDYVKKIDQAGHEIGTHSATHSHMSKQSSETIKNEILSSSQAITNVTGKPVTLFRPPYGDYNDNLINTLDSMGIKTIQWSVDSLDWKDLTAEQITNRVVKKVKSGSIILCHNNGLHTAKALPMIFDVLLSSGYKFVPIGELVYKDNYYIDSLGIQRKK